MRLEVIVKSACEKFVRTSMSHNGWQSSFRYCASVNPESGSSVGFKLNFNEIDAAIWSRSPKLLEWECADVF